LNAAAPPSSSPAHSSRAEWWLTLPSLLWLTVFFAVPFLLILVLSFKTADVRGGLGEGWTLQSIRNLADPQYAGLAWRTFRVSLLSTAWCVLIALPVAWCLARAAPRVGQFLLLLIVVPFFTNFLIRVFAWKSLLHPEGPLSAWLKSWHLIGGDTLLLNNSGSVMLVMIYTNLPFAIFPLYAATQKFDFSLLEAARDLGASPARAFFTIFLPGIRQGLLSAGFMVFVCTMGQYVVPQVIGGTGDEMLGAKIAQRVTNDRNLPQACALASALMLAGLLPYAAARFLTWLLRSRPNSVPPATSTPPGVYPA
jgi:ABC-type spermidine/putrescine transport system permease subunit I